MRLTIRNKNNGSLNPHNPRLVSARFNFDSGDVANYVAIWNAPAPWSVRVFTKSKYLVSQPIETLSYIDQNSRQLIKVQLVLFLITRFNHLKNHYGSIEN